MHIIELNTWDVNKVFLLLAPVWIGDGILGEECFLETPAGKLEVEVRNDERFRSAGRLVSLCCLGDATIH